MNTKTIIKSINLSFFLILIPFMLISQTSKQSGNWSDNNSWDNKSPGDNIKKYYDYDSSGTYNYFW